MHKKHKGAHSEMIACCWLLKSGYEVYRNVSAHGSADLVASKDGEVLFLDVKSTNDRGGLQLLRKEQIEAGILPLHVFKNGECLIENTPRRAKNSSEGKICPHCKSEFISGNILQVYCSRYCGHAARTKKFELHESVANDNDQPKDAVA